MQDALGLFEVLCFVTHHVFQLYGQPFVAEGGSLAVPEAPGLGIEVDENKVNAFRISY